eukprot:g1012.t1
MRASRPENEQEAPHENSSTSKSHLTQTGSKRSLVYKATPSIKPSPPTTVSTSASPNNTNGKAQQQSGPTGPAHRKTSERKAEAAEAAAASHSDLHLCSKVFWHAPTDVQRTPMGGSRFLPNFYADKLPFGELYQDRRKRIAKLSPDSFRPGWDLESVIIKTGDDLKQEALAMQLIVFLDRIWRRAGIPLLLRPYGVLPTSPSSGVIETVVDANSIDSLKKGLPHGQGLPEFFAQYFAKDSRYAKVNANTVSFQEAHTNYVRSLAAYSLVTYLLKLRDRHNGNIMLTTHGAILHIDYGFMLGTAPGGVDFEGADFKLTSEYVQVMGRASLPEFQKLFLRGFLEGAQACA